MGYNRENFNRIKQEYEEKYAAKREAAERRKAEVQASVPGLAALDRQLEATGAQLMRVICSGAPNVKESVEQIRQQNARFVAERKALLASHGYPENYTDIQYDCEKCGDSGYVDTKMCDCMRKRLIYAGYESSGMAHLLREQSFDNFSPSYFSNKPELHAIMSRNFAIMKDFAENFRTGSGENLALFGGTGLGKTHLSSAVAGRVIERGFDVVYVSAVTLFSDFENRRFGNGQNPEAGNVERYTSCDLLIVDDLGTEVINQFTVSCLYNIINTRLNKKLSTIISTNLTQTEFRQKYWDRITSRVLGDYLSLLFCGTDVRAQKAREATQSKKSQI